MSGQVVYLAEYCPDGDAQGVALHHQPRVKLLGICSTLEEAEDRILKTFNEIDKIFFNYGKPLRSIEKPKGIYFYASFPDGQKTFGRIRPITVDAEVDSPLSIW